ncbi:hypothetical protein GOARA_063_00630 [Gordonia araii NBRC 100433]|uniref:DUF4304 domain-containing protein n=1 Tax=Gordonia araii NBRC 100433 TaxID=1073574 RepID=G7H4T9_9ACTN|nr:DUF4304 domain-containing protein [Gordonia araii]NNG97996.1 DUF4304 domain-containing protein [Gordonia araii NBRC 100433]GAB10864.1 hypothetical protein GOARA_063_00630 [Gordonia araii NBRC 100433]
MASELSRTLDEIVAQVGPTLRTAGFRKRGRTYNRTISPGFVHVVNFQLGRVIAPFDTLQIRGRGPNPYAYFAVNLGVFVAEAWRLESSRFGPEGPPIDDKKWISESDCQLRRRLSRPQDNRSVLRRFVGRRNGGESWPLGDASTVARLTTAITTDGFGWLARYPDRTALLAELEGRPPSSHETCGIGGPDHLLAVRMHLASGNTARAQAIFTDYVLHRRAHLGAEPHLGGHLERLSEYADEVGLSFPN